MASTETDKGVNSEPQALSQDEINKQMALIVKEREALRLKLSRKYYLEEVIPAKKNGKTVVYFPGSGLSELAYAFDNVVPVAPSDNYTVFTCARRQQQKYIDIAESQGLNIDVCSYDRVGFGLMYTDEGAFGAVPPPDIIIGQGNICETHSKYWEIVSDFYGNTPYFVFDQPSHLQRERFPDYAIEYGASQVRRALRFIAEHTGQKLDMDRFKEVMGLSIQCFTEYWDNVVEKRVASPSPWSTVQSQNDAFILSAYMGRPEAKEYFDMIAKEVDFRVKYKVGVNPNEKFRLLYTDLPPWFQMNLMKVFHDKGGTLAFEAYPSILWLRILFDKYNNIEPIYEINPDKPDEAMALRLFTMGSQRNHKQTVEGYVVATKKYNLDGAIFFTNRTCAQCTRAVPLKERQYREMTGKPTMMFQGEHCDARSFSESQTMAKIDAFFESMERNKNN
jgi:benzoyl-CoA reductase/2-hydroxyglutaryl-CoA dehydratase subunit BcrC/BadD/HgdB